MLSQKYQKYNAKQLIQPYGKALSDFIAAYRKIYSSSHVLIRLIEIWKKHLENKKILGTILMDL